MAILKRADPRREKIVNEIMVLRDYQRKTAVDNLDVEASNDKD